MTDLRRIEAKLLNAIHRLEIRAASLTPLERLKRKSLLANLRIVQTMLPRTRTDGPAEPPQ